EEVEFDKVLVDHLQEAVDGGIEVALGPVLVCEHITDGAEGVEQFGIVLVDHENPLSRAACKRVAAQVLGLCYSASTAGADRGAAQRTNRTNRDSRTAWLSENRMPP